MKKQDDNQTRVQRAEGSHARLLGRFLQRSLHLFVISILCSLCVSVLDLVNPRIIGYAVDTVIGNAADLPAFLARIPGIRYVFSGIGAAALAVVVLALLAALFRFLAGTFNAKGAETLVRRMRELLFSHLLRLPLSWYAENQTGDIIQRCTSDVETIKNFVSEQLTQLFRTILLIVLALAFMSGISRGLTLIAFLFIPVIVLYSLFFHSRIGAAFQRADEEEGKLSSIVQENLTGVRVVRAFGREAQERERFETKNRSYTEFWVHLMKLLSAFWASGDLISGLQVMLVVVLGAAFCVRGQLSAGNYIAFITYNAMLTWPVRSLGRVISEMSKAGISIDRIAYILSSKEEDERDGGEEPDLHQDITFSHVFFRYQEELPLVLSDVSFTVRAGETLGILGGTGSGKTTAAELLDALYDLPEGCGSIRIGDTDLRDISRHYLRRGIGFVQQEPYLFSGTLLHNLTLANPAATKDEVEEAAKISCLDEAVAKFEEGYETVVGERGVTLSGGQKQRTAIAQMLLGNPTIMIFDDALSAVDAATDAKIRRALSQKSKDATVLLVTHRITTLSGADRILVLDHGRVAELGTPQELYEKNGLYRRIYDLQAAGREEDAG
ncbi:MAG: ABC transporter ATP-binding protein [Lachnospiraceae bacterium]|nr:ABC transporter ATP-binding protein [Lachnospiraceae bacterium]